MNVKFRKITLYLIFFVVFLLCGCKQVKYVYVPQIEYQTKDSLVIKAYRDSIYVNVKEYIKGDTIYRDSLVYKYVLRNDTIMVSSMDSIPYPVEVPKYIEKDLNTYQKTFIKLGWTFIGVIIGAIVYVLIKLYLKR